MSIDVVMVHINKDQLALAKCIRSILQADKQELPFGISVDGKSIEVWTKNSGELGDNVIDYQKLVDDNPTFEISTAG